MGYCDSVQSYFLPTFIPFSKLFFLKRRFYLPTQSSLSILIDFFRGRVDNKNCVKVIYWEDFLGEKKEQEEEQVKAESQVRLQDNGMSAEGSFGWVIQGTQDSEVRATQSVVCRFL